ncbi:MAG TPA: Lrp/AsnC family transcriptional regulator [Burkholderiales bacterium]|jgi:DNA-binding Lrp family transcriptional regulator
MLDATDFLLVNPWQRGFPLTARPFRDIAWHAGLPESTVLSRFAEMKKQGVLDRIGPVFRPNTVGASSLAAMAVPPERLEEVAALVSAQPGVNHNYEREHRYNLWFVATAPGAAAVQSTLSRIEHASGIAVLRLPLLEEFHIDLGFDLDTGSAPRADVSRPAGPPSEEERRLAAALAGGLPFVERPYDAVARTLGLSEEEVLALLAKMLAEGRIRRIGAVIRHRRIGYEANAMAVWNVPDSQVAEIGRALGRDPCVTLCYRRARALPHWPYNLYCMVHGKERATVLEKLASIETVKPFPGEVLFSVRCFSQRAAQYG